MKPKHPKSYLCWLFKIIGPLQWTNQFNIYVNFTTNINQFSSFCLVPQTAIQFFFILNPLPTVLQATSPNDPKTEVLSSWFACCHLLSSLGSHERKVYHPSKNWMGFEWDLANGPRSVSCHRTIRYSGSGVREKWVLLEISWIPWNSVNKPMFKTKNQLNTFDLHISCLEFVECTKPLAGLLVMLRQRMQQVKLDPTSVKRHICKREHFLGSTPPKISTWFTWKWGTPKKRRFQ